MNKDQQKTRRFVRGMIRRTGLSATGLARKAGIAPSTLTRLVNGTGKNTLSARTLAKLSRVSGVDVPAGPAPAGTPENDQINDSYSGVVRVPGGARPAV